MKTLGFIVAILLTAAIANSQNRRPTSRPTTRNELTDANNAIDESNRALTSSRADLSKRRTELTDQFDASPDGQRLAKEFLDADIALEQARKTKDMKQILSLGSLRNKKKDALESVRTNALMSDPRYSDLVAAVKSNEANVAKAKAEAARIAADQEARDPIKQALARQHIVVGMTREQAESIIRSTANVVNQAAESVTVKYALPDDRVVVDDDHSQQVLSGFYILYVTYTFGKVESISRTSSQSNFATQRERGT